MFGIETEIIVILMLSPIIFVGLSMYIASK